jgi:hypothetical protein
LQRTLKALLNGIIGRLSHERAIHTRSIEFL